MDPDGDKAEYWESERLCIVVKAPLWRPVIAPPTCDFITGLLAHWVGFLRYRHYLSNGLADLRSWH